MVDEGSHVFGVGDREWERKRTNVDRTGGTTRSMTFR